MMFHRQAQAAVLIGMPKLKELGVGTRRPDDYFAQMAKTDQHMQKMMFHRQAQAAVLIGMPKLKELGVGTRRPDDYFAQMAKTDQHMQKVRENLQKKQFEEARSEKAKKQRQLRKMGKQIQVETKLRRESEKRQLAEEVKKYRKGLRTDLDFLEDNKKRRPTVAGQKKLPSRNKTQAKRDYKDKKFGFGGKKRGLKTNTKESSADFADYRHPKKPTKGQQQRPGKSKRMKMSSKKRR
uniref:(California timema) hypothetical protein n=1 Tax=Timema californicum TaxID=61474 RepID=A0A7R9JHL0_TIMCA|nr:unnamed protein product [Timema californicum]